eukprot:7496563-Ditylum_brightwellii.AAC.1
MAGQAESSTQLTGAHQRDYTAPSTSTNAVMETKKLDLHLRIIIYSGLMKQSVNDIKSNHPDVMWDGYCKLTNQQTAIGWD